MAFAMSSVVQCRASGTCAIEDRRCSSVHSVCQSLSMAPDATALTRMAGPRPRRRSCNRSPRPASAYASAVIMSNARSCTNPRSRETHEIPHPSHRQGAQPLGYGLFDAICAELSIPLTLPVRSQLGHVAERLPNELFKRQALVGMWSLSDIRKHCWLELTILCRFRHSRRARRAA